MGPVSMGPVSMGPVSIGTKRSTGATTSTPPSVAASVSAPTVTELPQPATGTASIHTMR